MRKWRKWGKQASDVAHSDVIDGVKIHRRKSRFQAKECNVGTWEGEAIGAEIQPDWDTNKKSKENEIKAWNAKMPNKTHTTSRTIRREAEKASYTQKTGQVYRSEFVHIKEIALSKRPWTWDESYKLWLAGWLAFIDDRAPSPSPSWAIFRALHTLSPMLLKPSSKKTRPEYTRPAKKNRLRGGLTGLGLFVLGYPVPNSAVYLWSPRFINLPMYTRKIDFRHYLNCACVHIVMWLWCSEESYFSTNKRTDDAPCPMPHVSLLLRCGDIAKHFRDVAYKYFLGRVTQTIEYYYYMVSLTHTQKKKWIRHAN